MLTHLRQHASPYGHRPWKACLYTLYLISLSFALYLLTNIPDLGNIEAYGAESNLQFKLVDGLLIVAFYVILLDLFIRWRYIGWFIWLPVLFFQGIRVYMYQMMGICMIQNHVGVFLETNWNEAKSYLTWMNIALLAGFLLLNTAIYLIGRCLLPQTRAWARYLLIACELYALYTLIGHISAREGFHYCTPLRSALVTAHRAQQMLRNGGSPELVHLRQLPPATTGKSSRIKSDKPLTVIYFVGESVRADHLQLNGYHRNTTPHLMSRASIGEVINFPQVISYGTGTQEAMIGLFTNATNEHRAPTSGSFVSLLKMHGYETSMVTNIPKGAVPTLAAVTTECDQFLYYESEYCDGLLHHLRKLKNSPEKDRFIIIQTNGSHYDYPHRYPHECFSVYKPDENYQDISADNPALINSYDNSIVYTDFILNEIMNIFADTNTVLLYTSDHGESFGEGGRFLHLGPLTATEQRQVPLIIWGTTSYRSVFAQQWETMKQHTRESLQHGHLFHTILSIAGIESVWKQPHLDLTKPASTPANAPVSGTN